MIHHKPFGGMLEKGGIFLNNGHGKNEMDVAREAMLLQLEQMQRCGVKLFVDNRAVQPKEAVAKAVRENSPYMADYVFDTAGVISQVRFDRVTKR